MWKKSHPTKEQIREYLRHRRQEQTPPPDIKEIRRQLGWDLFDAVRRKRTK